ncbi:MULTISPECIES: Rv1733c family protein [unclassified Streptomyces]|uniref:Rv1733c family protein n=1 Tax=unclassified Streptomyces TaxID=2593676 RepID=UPI003427F0BB
MTRTPPTAVTRDRLWRWRHNPLRRHSDVVEAWVVLVTWTLALLGAALGGWAAAHSVDATLTARRAHVHAVSAVLTDGAARTPAAGSGYDDGRVWATARWTGPDGKVHMDRAKVLPGAPAGSQVTVWTDPAGRAVPEPASAAETMLQTVLTGALVAQVAGTTVWAGGWLVRNALVRRRLAEWDEEWKRVGPEWRNYSGGRG